MRHCLLNFNESSQKNNSYAFHPLTCGSRCHGSEERLAFVGRAAHRPQPAELRPHSQGSGGEQATLSSLEAAKRMEHKEGECISEGRTHKYLVCVTSTHSSPAAAPGENMDWLSPWATLSHRSLYPSRLPAGVLSSERAQGRGEDPWSEWHGVQWESQAHG